MLRDDLIAARALIDTPEKWGCWTGPRARRGEGRSLPCALEALRIAEASSAAPGSEPVYDFRLLRGWRALADALPEGSKYRDFQGPGKPYLGGYNDDPDTTHADVMAWFDRAIQAATPEPENKS